MLDHLGDLVLGAQERAGEVDGDGLAPTGFRNASRWAGLAKCAGIVEGDIQPAIGLDRQRYQRLGIILRSDVARERHRAAAAGNQYLNVAST